MQIKSGPQTLEIGKWAACNRAGLHALQCERSAAACPKRYSGILPRPRRMDIADTRVCCSAARRWGRHTLNCQQKRKAESCEICILTATVHRSVKSHCHRRWCTEKQEGRRERICEGSLTLMKTEPHEETYHRSFYCLHSQFNTAKVVTVTKDKTTEKLLHWCKWLHPRGWGQIYLDLKCTWFSFQIVQFRSFSKTWKQSCLCIKLSAWHTGGLSVPIH